MRLCVDWRRSCGAAHLQLGGRNPTDGAKNRARSLTEALKINNNVKKYIFLHFF